MKKKLTKNEEKVLCCLKDNFGKPLLSGVEISQKTGLEIPDVVSITDRLNTYKLIAKMETARQPKDNRYKITDTGLEYFETDWKKIIIELCVVIAAVSSVIGVVLILSNSI